MADCPRVGMESDFWERDPRIYEARVLEINSIKIAPLPPTFLHLRSSYRSLFPFFFFSCYRTNNSSIIPSFKSETLEIKKYSFYIDRLVQSWIEYGIVAYKYSWDGFG